MKLIVNIPNEDCIFYISMYNGIPLEDKLKDIKEDMKDTFYDYKNNRYDVSMEGVLDVLDKYIQESKE